MIRSSTRLAAVAGTLLILQAFAFQPSFAQTPPVTTVVLTGARVIDGTGRAPLENATLLIRNGRVEAIGAPAGVAIPAGATRIDVSGKTIVPGFINAHGHLSNGDQKLPPQVRILQQLRLFAQYGVTTVYAMGGYGDGAAEIVKVRDAWEPGRADGARAYVSATVVSNSVEEARQSVDKAVAMKVDFIKTRMNRNQMNDMATAYKRVKDMEPEVYRAVIEQSHKHGLRVLAHVYMLEDAKGLVGAGLDMIGHAVRDADLDPAFIAELKRRNVGYIATMARDLAEFEYETTPAYFTDPFFLRGLPLIRKDMEELKNPAAQEKVRTGKLAPVIKKALQQNMRNLKLLSDAGAAIAMGTDSGTGVGQWVGYSEHVELELMTRAGLTPMQALVSATGGAARVTKLDQHLGTLQPGKWADFIVLGANPLTDIRNTRKIDSVWIAGRRVVGPTGTN